MKYIARLYIESKIAGRPHDQFDIGFAHDKEEKKQYVHNRWLPAVNNVLDKYEMDEWYFLEVAGEIKDIKNEIRTFLKTVKGLKRKCYDERSCHI